MISRGCPKRQLILEIVEWEDHIRCVYLNNFRIAGQKPWGGGKTLAKFKVEEYDLEQAIKND